MLQIQNTVLPGVIIIELKAFADDRGFFEEIFRKNAYKDAGISENFVQFNHSRSNKDVLRGLHYQRTHAQGKLVTAIRGAVLDVVADIRPNSPTYGTWIAEELSDKNNRQLYIPPGYAHGFLALSETVDLLYACTDYYHAEDAFSIHWKDPTLNIQWPVDEPILSPIDSKAPFLSQINSEQLPVYISGK